MIKTSVTASRRPLSFLLLLPLVAMAACSEGLIIQPSDAPQKQRSISVRGEAVVTAVPDIAVLSFGVSVSQPTSTAAFEQASIKTNAVIAALKDAGIEDRDVQTEQVSLRPIYAENDRGRRDRNVIVAYEAYQGLVVRLRQIKSAGSVIDAAVRAGANGLNSFQMTIDDTAGLRDEARVVAVKNAVGKASRMAEAAGASLGPVLSLSANDNNRPRPMARGALMAMEEVDAAPSIEAGEQTIQVTVNATFSLE
ncbi:MAG: SIMPL domain-containing protein [Pseudomonadota bacterium]